MLDICDFGVCVYLAVFAVVMFWVLLLLLRLVLFGLIWVFGVYLCFVDLIVCLLLRLVYVNSLVSRFCFCYCATIIVCFWCVVMVGLNLL